MYNPEILSATLRELQKIRKEKEQELEDRRNQIYDAIPRIREIEQELKTFALEILKLSLGQETEIEKQIQKLQNKNEALQKERAELLILHGYPTHFLSVQYTCPVCSDMGYLGTTPCLCLENRYQKKASEYLSNILPLPNQSFETFSLSYYSAETDPVLGISPHANMQYNVSICKHYAETFHKSASNLLLYGSAGLGKTFLSTAIAKYIAEHGYSVSYDTAVSIFANFEKEKFANGTDLSFQMIQKYQQSDLLIIDDLGAEMQTAFTMTTLYQLINTRLMHHRPMIINTNLTPAIIEQRYSEAIASRLLGEFQHLRFFGEDIRMKKKHGVS